MSIKNRTIFCRYQKMLEAIYPSQEAKEIVYRLAEHFWGISRPKLLLMLDEDEDAALAKYIDACTERLLQHEPLQYVIGEVEFYGCRFKVSRSVLIPRPETEELVDIIVKDWEGKAPRIADFGTGSGCIPVSLAKALPHSAVRSIDISAEALEIARENAQLNGADVDFVLADMRAYSDSSSYDIIVSNPPYVMNSEKEQMRDNVLRHEPHLALFVEDGNPLEFYIPIAEFASRSLAADGVVYLEINQQLGPQTAELFRAKGMCAEVRQDMFGVDRFVVARWK
ncbi:peptide chain release factor N(5)-glutamine methyltransferase [uncultured Acetobacteroides sp.]|uniref:peptide chain release factor N(5)-glutamine methyltransferase n=1 Tax=uncultured Acetobacteroides sp. TaxID=1760811 RepID=UPI0029F4FA62|nr:peptide chain release factor N(5)-glutamine methyltransferase [uncultured Acetobacteroides sp.]